MAGAWDALEKRRQQNKPPPTAQINVSGESFTTDFDAIRQSLNGIFDAVKVLDKSDPTLAIIAEALTSMVATLDAGIKAQTNLVIPKPIDTRDEIAELKLEICAMRDDVKSATKINGMILESLEKLRGVMGSEKEIILDDDGMPTGVKIK